MEDYRVGRLPCHARQTANRELLDRCVLGDQAAWSELVARYERLIYAIPIREGLSVDDAADITQDTFAALLRSVSTVDDPDRLGSWLMTVARRLTWHRRHIVRSIRPVEPIEPSESPHDDLVHALWVYEAVKDLGEPCSEIILALFFDPAEPSYAQLAVRMGRPIGSLGPMRSRCLGQLKRALEDGAAA